MTEEPNRYLRPIRKGEYDLVNISLVGFDPITGKSYAECSAEWRATLDEVEKEAKAVRWWQLRARWAVGLKLGALRSHFGVPAGFLAGM